MGGKQEAPGVHNKHEEMDRFADAPEKFADAESPSAEPVDSDEDDQRWDGWDEGDDDHDAITRTKCFFSPQGFLSPEEALAYDAEQTGFQYVEFCKRNKIDFYGRIRFVNFLRTRMEENTALLDGKKFETLKDCVDHMVSSKQFEQLMQAGAEHQKLWADDKYMIPV